ncbi:hypothetical protein HMPREF9102_0390 [Limosilactobacillus oris F0423]|uniref:Uncharacterized protein n=1 Tax=Limosilactobacillus oris F0423 TaxID=944562 RepID=A0ABN0D8H6_9LACO|nr:hypothetical protein HMPREF9102_0390 [Limosilactobacillus oris F0423]
MRITLEGTPREIKELLNAIGGSKEQLELGADAMKKIIH